MTWLRQKRGRHGCILPTIGKGTDVRPDGHRGDVWICDECERVWVITESDNYPGQLSWSIMYFFTQKWRAQYHEMRERGELDGDTETASAGA